jgi:phosphoribosylanthranilate isomerase
MKKILWKVCGMKFKENIAELESLAPSYMGFIFYAGSKRNAGGELDFDQLKHLSESIIKVAVFVNESVEEIHRIAQSTGIKTIQLHGGESPLQCQELRNMGYRIIKAFSVDDYFSFESLKPYYTCCDFFLFDSKGEGYGGNGRKFNWKVLLNYDNKIPFFLSGGVDQEDLEEIKKLSALNIHAVDINSKFEITPGYKNVEKIRIFKKELFS